ncbi:MAG: hypothetical protein ABSH08_08815 [Tepidisphaeraceae bacterium]
MANARNAGKRPRIAARRFRGPSIGNAALWVIVSFGRLARRSDIAKRNRNVSPPTSRMGHRRRSAHDWSLHGADIVSANA